MGRERGPGPLRRPPRGWIAARAYPVERAILAEDPDAEGSRGGVIETSHRLEVTWEVHVEGREPIRFSEERRGPAWILDGSPSGKRWYQPRLRRSHGLWKSVGVPGFVDPADPTNLWVDWDAAYEEHTHAWDRKGRVEREIASREGAFDRITHRIFNPFDGKLRPGEEAIVEAEMERRSEAAARSREQAIAANRSPIPDDEHAEIARRIAHAQWLKSKGRKATAVVVAQAATGRQVGQMPVLHITLDVEDGGATRRVVYEHIWGRPHAEMYPVGKRIKVRVDPEDPQRVEIV
jgi:hypothetical protein